MNLKHVKHKIYNKSNYDILDTPSQMFLRNKETMRISSPSPSTLLVPCRPSHMNALVNYSLPTGLSRVTPTYLPTEGILLQFPNAESVSHVKGIFTCKLQTAEGKVLETLGFLYPPSSIDANGKLKVTIIAFNEKKLLTLLNIKLQKRCLA